MSFHWPYALLALPLALAVLLALFYRSYRARLRLLTQFAAARLLPALMASYSPNLRRLKHGLIIFGVLLVVFALARPQWGYDWQEQRAKGVDVIFVIDTSKSMLTQDIPPDRLERAKLAIMDLVEKMPGNRVGLVAFAGQAFLQCPLTLDYDAFRQTLDAVDTTTISRGGTNIAAGLDEAAAALENSGNHKVVVLLSDGEDLEGQGVDTAKSLGAENVTVFTVGVGTPQGDIIPLPAKDGQVDFVRDDRGQIVKSHLDAATLTAIAQATGGFYQPLGATGEGLVKVYEAGIKPLPQEQVASRLQRVAIERFQWPLALGLLLLAIEPLIGTRRLFRADERRRAALAALPILPPERKSPAKAAAPVTVALLIAAIAIIPSPRAHAQSSPASSSIAPATVSPAAPASPVSTSSTAPADQPASATPSPTATPAIPPSPPSVASSSPPSAPASPRAAETLFNQGDYKAAAQAYGDAATAAPQDGRFRYDQGASLYRGGDYAGAAQAFQQTLSANDLSLQQHAYYGLGNAQYRQGQAELQQDPKTTVSTWESAAKDYKNALELNPGDTDATYNLNLVNQELAALKKQLEQQQKQQQQQNQQNQQNQPDQQNQNNSQQNQQNQSQPQQNQNGQQNQQQSQNQQGQQNQQQNQNGQQGQQQQQNGGQSQSQQNQNSQQNQQGQQGQQQKQNGQQNQPQNQSPGHSGASNQNQNQPQNSPQNQGQNQNQSSQSQQKPGQNGEPKRPQPQSGAQGQNQNPQPTPNGQPKPQNAQTNQGQPNQPKQNPAQAGEPSAQKPGQQSGASGAAAAASGTDKNAPNGNATASIPGVMTQEEAGQVLDSLKDTERKLPMNNYDAQKEGAQESPDKPFKDW